MDAIVGQDAVIAYLRGLLAQDSLPPHLLLLGPTGNGKSRLARAFIAAFLLARGVPIGAAQEPFLCVATSVDDRGIAAVRGRIADFAKRVKPRRDVPGWVFLDDADSLPLVSQQALRRLLEDSGDGGAAPTRFLFAAESADAFAEPLQSRCVMLQLERVDLTRHGAALVAQHAPALALSTDAAAWLAAMAAGNPRLYVRFLQMLLATAPGDGSRVTVDAATAQAVVNAPPVRRLKALGEAALARDRLGVTRALLELWSLGVSFEDVIALLGTVLKHYTFFTPTEALRLYDRCGEGHIAMIRNKTSLLDAIDIFCHT